MGEAGFGVFNNQKNDSSKWGRHVNSRCILLATEQSSFIRLVLHENTHAVQAGDFMDTPAIDFSLFHLLTDGGVKTQRKEAM